MTEAQIRFDENRQGDAESSMRRAVASLEKAFGPDHPTVGAAYGTLSQILGAEAQYPAAFTAASHALEILTAALGEHHPTVAVAQVTLAQELLAPAALPEARALLMRADTIYIETYGLAHPSRIGIYANLGQLGEDTGDWEGALAAYRTARDLIARTEGPESASIAGVEHDIANCLGSLNRLDEALVAAQHAVTILEKLGVDGENRLGNALIVVAEVHVARERPELALPLAERALALATRRTAESSPTDLADAQYLMARVLWDTHGDRARALTLAKAATKTPDPDKRALIESWISGRAR